MNLARLYKYLRHKECRLDFSHAAALMLFRDESSMTVGEVRRYLGCCSPNVTQILDHLVKQELVRRWRVESDRRSVYVAVTGKGQEMQRRIIEKLKPDEN